MLYVKKVFINKYESGKMKAFATVVFSLREDEESGISIGGYKVFEGPKGLFAVSPTQGREKDGKMEYYPILKVDQEIETAKEWEVEVLKTVLSEYQKQNTKPDRSAPPIDKSSKKSKKSTVLDDDPDEW